MIMEQDPIKRFRDAYARAEQSGVMLSDACALATADDKCRPSLRMVLLKAVDDRGFVFYTNLASRKARELAANPQASLCFWWPPLQEQVRIEGVVERVSDSEADEYFGTRDRSSQLGAWASKQSREMESREELTEAFEDVATRYEGRDVPRPPHWSGYVLVPQRIEFWLGKPYRLHERYLYTRQGGGWGVTLLYP